jgi:hypothetical protein
MVAPAPIVYRDRITVHRDARAAGSAQPAYTDEILTLVPAEILQVSGGEIIRGKTVEAITAFVVSLRNIPSVPIGADCQVTVTSGTYKDHVLWVHRVHYENMHGRPVRQQLHCKTRNK